MGRRRDRRRRHLLQLERGGGRVLHDERGVAPGRAALADRPGVHGRQHRAAHGAAHGHGRHRNHVVRRRVPRARRGGVDRLRGLPARQRRHVPPGVPDAADDVRDPRDGQQRPQQLPHGRRRTQRHRDARDVGPEPLDAAARPAHRRGDGRRHAQRCVGPARGHGRRRGAGVQAVHGAGGLLRHGPGDAQLQRAVLAVERGVQRRRARALGVRPRPGDVLLPARRGGVRGRHERLQRRRGRHDGRRQPACQARRPDARGGVRWIAARGLGAPHRRRRHAHHELHDRLPPAGHVDVHRHRLPGAAGHGDAGAAHQRPHV
mmetsp:Transcript_15932/g.55479  ORF Transcript_15932/g.55479 Transcript_15932/m.55479 type:complete len:318 (+) Transcript_15932:7480-8433(+)